jgi:hypothetical protein
MLRVGSESVWQLKRGQTLYRRISDRELLLLFELGHLKPGDLLWKPGLGGWKSAEALSGVLTTPQRPSGRSLITQAYAVQIKTLLAGAWKAVIRSQVKVTLIAKHHAQSLNFSLLRSYPPWGKTFELPNVLRRMLRGQESSLGLLIALVFVGFAGIAFLASFAIGAQTPTEHALPTKLQGRPIAALAPDTARPGKISNFSELQPAIEPLASQSVSNPLASESAAQTDSASNSPSVSQSESAAQTNSVAIPPSLPQSESAAQTDPISNPPSPSQSAAQTASVPMPTRKPGRPSTNAAKRITQRQGPREPKAMRFGSIGYNYDPQ